MVKTRWLCTTGISLIEADAKHRLIRLYMLAAVIVIFMLHACTENSENRKRASFEQQSEIMEIRPQKPAKIKLKRSITGQYSWDLSADDAEKVLEADRKLREELGK